MMMLKVLIVFGALCMTVSAGILNLTRNESYYWEEGVQMCYDGCKYVLDRYPNDLNDFGKNLMTSFGTHVFQLKMLTKSKSTILSKSSVRILDGVSMLSKLGINERHLLREYGRALPNVLFVFKRVVRKLDDYIGELTYLINDAIRNVEKANINIINQFLQRKIYRSGDINFQPLIKSVHILSNILGFITKIALNDPEIQTVVYQAITIPIFISNNMFIAAQGTYATIASEFEHSQQMIPEDLDKILKTFEPFILGMKDSIALITDDNVTEMLKVFVDVAANFNNNVNSQFGFSKEVKITAEEVQENLLRGN